MVLLQENMDSIKKNLDDTTLIDNSNRMTKMLLEAGMDINKICLLVKDYQRKYCHIRDQGAPPELLKAYTPDIWWKMSKTENGVSILNVA